jgi:hypothetical protein
MSREDGPTLTDAVGMGGVIAQDGFDYQVWEAMERLPAWLRQSAFEELGLEMLEDIEARFFAPQAPARRLLDRFQAKSADMQPADVEEVFRTFHAFDTKYPQLARVHTLITPRLPATLRWIARDVARVRRARPFYAPFAEVAAASDAKLRADLIEKYGEPLGDFIIRGVEVEEVGVVDRRLAQARFNQALESAFPGLAVTQARYRSAFDALETRLRASKGSAVARATLIALLEEELGQSLGLGGPFHLHMRSDRGEANAAAFEFDASAFSGGAAAFPPPQMWARDLVTPLVETARWVKKHGGNRVVLSGSYRISTAFVLGWAFRSAHGFDLEIPTRDGAWATNAHAPVGEPRPGWDMQGPEGLDAETLVVSVGILRDPAVDIVSSGERKAGQLLALRLAEPITSAQATQASVRVVKEAVDAAAARLRPKRIALYYAGPVAFAVALGHRWNAMQPTHVYEFLQAERRYVPTALVGANELSGQV